MRLVANGLFSLYLGDHAVPSGCPRAQNLAISPINGPRVSPNNLAIPFFDEVIRERYPADQLPMDKPVTLKPYPKDRVWLGNIEGWKEKLHTGEISLVPRPRLILGVARGYGPVRTGPDPIFQPQFLA